MIWFKIHSYRHIIPEQNEDHLIKPKKIIEINLPRTTISLKQGRNPDHGMLTHPYLSSTRNILWESADSPELQIKAV
jgi:hypothetical protein